MRETEETAVFVFLDLNLRRLLLEKREAKGSFANQIIFPGGSQIVGENLEETARRETKEELGVEIIAMEKVSPDMPVVGETKKRLHLFAITQWEGQIPKQVIDKGNELFWVDFKDLGTTIKIKSSRKIAAMILTKYR